MKTKKIKILLITFLIIIILITGCSKIQGDKEINQETNQVEKQLEAEEEMEEDAEEASENKDKERGERYYLKKYEELFDSIDNMTKQEVLDMADELREPGSVGQLGYVLYQHNLYDSRVIDSLSDPQLQKEGLKAIIMSDEYGLDFSMPDPYTGEIYCELTVEDIEYFKHPKDGLGEKMSKTPLKDRKHLLYRNYFDYLEEGREKELLSRYVETWTYIHLHLILQRGFGEVRFYTIPELFTQHSENTFMIQGVLVNRWPEEPGGNLKEILGDLAGDGNYYKHHTTFIYKINDGVMSIDKFILSVEDEYMVNLGPDYKHPEVQPSFIRFLVDRYKDNLKNIDIEQFVNVNEGQ